ncbi:protein of unknown function [Xenorhabdus poinarii G6]|uniref:Uncharacterized protein n=1 Tax=Xenorhabdus poinarii G6 TaxID=1354304 RepID=A0A068R4Z0_9GAMM|nr:protein of unknown function [Xenorhabdus poinarii G6]
MQAALHPTPPGLERAGRTGEAKLAKLINSVVISHLRTQTGSWIKPIKKLADILMDCRCQR